MKKVLLIMLSVLFLFTVSSAKTVKFKKIKTLSSTSWKLTDFQNETLIYQYIGSKTLGEITLNFAKKENLVSGFSGVNTYSTNYTLKMDDVSISRIGSTKKAGPKELMDFVCSRPSLHLLPEIVKMTMSMKKKAYQLVELTSNWSNDFGDALQTGIPKPFTFKEKTLMEELEITEADLKNKSVAASVKDLENWNKEDTYKEAINVTKQLIKL